MARFWLVWTDDTPIAPEHPLGHAEAVELFAAEVEEDPDQKVEIRQCSDEDLRWAGNHGGVRLG